MNGDCPTGCGRSVQAGKLMCPPCWRKVPRDLQRKVYLAWSAWRKDFSSDDAMKAYDQARENALAAIA